MASISFEWSEYCKSTFHGRDDDADEWRTAGSNNKYFPLKTRYNSKWIEYRVHIRVKPLDSPIMRWYDDIWWLKLKIIVLTPWRSGDSTDRMAAPLTHRHSKHTNQTIVETKTTTPRTITRTINIQSAIEWTFSAVQIVNMWKWSNERKQKKKNKRKKKLSIS